MNSGQGSPRYGRAIISGEYTAATESRVTNCNSVKLALGRLLKYVETILKSKHDISSFNLLRSQKLLPSTHYSPNGNPCKGWGGKAIKPEELGIYGHVV